MIQRIQSIFLALAGAGFFSLFKYPFATSSESIPNYMNDQMYDINDHIVLLVMTILGGLLSLVVLFLYNNRSMQLKLNNVLIVISILLPLVAFLLFYNEGTAAASQTTISDAAGLYILCAIFVFSILSSVFIKKDKNLVESMDRLR